MSKGGTARFTITIYVSDKKAHFEIKHKLEYNNKGGGGGVSMQPRSLDITSLPFHPRLHKSGVRPFSTKVSTGSMDSGLNLKKA